MTEINNGFKIYSQVLVLKSLKLNIARVLVPLPVSLVRYITRAQARIPILNRNDSKVGA